MSDKQILEWRNENACRSYPFRNTNAIETDFITDACFYLDPPVYLTGVQRTEFGLKITINGYIIFYYSIKATVPYAYNNFGKIMIGKVPSLIIGETRSYNLRFIDAICYGSVNLNLLNDTEEVEFEDVEVDGRDITINLNETPQFTYDCISSINDQVPPNSHFVLGGDNCTQVKMYPGQALLHDICKPPCYGCNDRLVSGDVSTFASSLESRILAIEQGGSVSHRVRIVSIVFYFDFTFPNLNKLKSLITGDIIKSVTLDIVSAFDAGVTGTIGVSGDVSKYVASDEASFSDPNNYKYDIYDSINSPQDLNLYLTGTRTTGSGKIVVETLEKIIT